MKQPHVYTLPEQFIKDPSVPARWRVWAVINGFFITGQKCWAGNEWIAGKIGTHKDTVSQAVKELEDIGVIRCERNSRSRSIYPMIGDNAYQWSVPTPINDRHQRLSISVSNSEKNTERSSDIVIVKDEEEKPSKPDRRVKEKESVFLLFGPKQAWWMSKAQRTAALALIDNYGMEQVTKAVTLAKSVKDDPFAPKINTPVQLVEKWGALLDYKNKKS